MLSFIKMITVGVNHLHSWMQWITYPRIGFLTQDVWVCNQSWPAQCASMESRDKSIGMSSGVGEGTRPPPSNFIFMHLPKLWYSSYFLQRLRRVPLNFFRTTSLGTSAHYHADGQTRKYKLKAWNYMVTSIEITEDTRGRFAEPRVTDVGGLGITTHK